MFKLVINSANISTLLVVMLFGKVPVNFNNWLLSVDVFVSIVRLLGEVDRTTIFSSVNWIWQFVWHLNS